jgi:protocatechuate 3,4-dioxygenase beta subunit
MPAMNSPTRRRALLLAGLSAACGVAVANTERRRLAAMTEGPFYPPARWRGHDGDWDADLATVRRRGQVLQARGELLGLGLRVLDTQGRVVDGAEVEIWQCDTLAAYRHPSVAATPGRFDPGFQGFGAGRSTRDGTLAFRTIRPVSYPGRTPHIHVKLRHASFGEVSSQLFVAGDPGNERDFLWRQLATADRDALAMVLKPATTGGLQWQAQHDLVLGV